MLSASFFVHHPYTAANAAGMNYLPSAASRRSLARCAV